jgi:hypothetical protein
MVKNTSIEKYSGIEKQADVSFFYKVESLKGLATFPLRLLTFHLKKPGALLSKPTLGI